MNTSSSFFSLFFGIGAFSYIKDNSNNKGWGKVDKKKEGALGIEKRLFVAGDNTGKTFKNMGVSTVVHTGKNKAGEKPVLSPKQSPHMSTFPTRVIGDNPHVIHKLSTIGCGERCVI
jgi:hypothetical protein